MENKPQVAKIEVEILRVNTDQGLTLVGYTGLGGQFWVQSADLILPDNEVLVEPSNPPEPKLSAKLDLQTVPVTEPKSVETPEKVPDKP